MAAAETTVEAPDQPRRHHGEDEQGDQLERLLGDPPVIGHVHEEQERRQPEGQEGAEPESQPER